MPHPRAGQIFWGICEGSRGKGERRPVIVASTRTEIARTGKVRVIVCSTKFHQPYQDEEVPLPWQVDGQVATQLKRQTVAVCDWIEMVPAASIGASDFGGAVPIPLLRTILARAGITLPPER